MKRVLITGGAGFVGSKLARRLAKNGYKVTVLDNYSKKNADAFSDLKNSITVIREDVRNSRAVRAAISNADAVFHLAAMVSIVESIQKPKECFEINVKASEHIIKECTAQKIKFIFASSAAIYGDQTQEILSESLTPKPISPYGKSKLEVENLCTLYAKSGLQYVCLRKFNIYGPGQSADDTYASAVPKFLSLARLNKPITTYGDGKQTRDFIHVNDIIDAYVKALDYSKSGIFNVGTGHATQIHDLIQHIISATQSKSKIARADIRKGDILHSRPSIQSFCKETGWQPSITMQAGINALSLQADTTLPASAHHPKLKMLIAMPAYNEGPVITKVIHDLKAEGFSEILVVDDCSKDDTSKNASKAGAMIIRHVINRGAGAATATAIQFAKINNYDFLILMDSDGQHSPRDIEPLLTGAQTHDVIIGSRNIDDNNMPFVRKIANKTGSFITWFFFGKYVRDSQSGFKVFNKRAIRNIMLTFDRFEFCSEIIGEINRKRLTFKEIPITVIYTEHSQSKGQSISNGFRMLARFVLRS